MAEFVLFGAGTPGALDEADGPIALSTQWRINTAGNYWVTHVEFYQAANAQPGGSSYEVAIWQRIDDATPGTKLASKTVLASSLAAGGGRRRIALDTPLLVTQAQAAGYYATLGTPQRYTATAGYFTSAGETSGPITAAQDGTGFGRNGRFKGAVATADYPTNNFNGGGYWVTPVVTDVDPGVTDVNVADRAGPSAGGGTPDAAQAEMIVTDPAGPSAAGGSAEALTVGVSVADRAGPAAAGGSPSLVEDGEPVNVVDQPGSVSGGGSGAAIAIEEASPDVAVWPIVQQALACLQTQMAAVQSPPKYVQIRPGVAFSAGLSGVEDECCEGSAWVRVVSITPSDSFPSQAVTSPCHVNMLAVELEFGALRCRPVSSNVVPGQVVTGDQWADMTRLILGDAAALRRTACCLAALVGQSVIGQWSPQAVEANCAGGTMTMTVQASACDLVC